MSWGGTVEVHLGFCHCGKSVPARLSDASLVGRCPARLDVPYWHPPDRRLLGRSADVRHRSRWRPIKRSHRPGEDHSRANWHDRRSQGDRSQNSHVTAKQIWLACIVKQLTGSSGSQNAIFEEPQAPHRRPRSGATILDVILSLKLERYTSTMFDISTILRIGRCRVGGDRLVQDADRNIGLCL
jgi:hypothetical protein